jgi:5,10-methenyltetrahydrofolate synthetase
VTIDAADPAARPAIGPREEMRLQLLALREAMQERARHERALVERVGRWLRAVPARRLASYWPTRGEADMTPAILEWLQQDPQRVVALPVIENELLTFAPWMPGQPLKTGAYGIPVPETTQRIVPQLLLVPCVGIDRRRYRLGYGAGFYDRTLPTISPRPVAVGIAFDCGRVETIEPMPHDFRLDLAITESGVW